MEYFWKRAALLVALAAGCDRTNPSAADAFAPAQQASSASPAPAESSALPLRVGAFVGGPLESGALWTRRRYDRGPVHLEVTVAGPTGTAVQYERWVEMSAGYPRMTLDLPQGDALGFYDCTSTGEDERCDAHIQTRSGLHVEINTGGSATRADVTAFMELLSTRRLAETMAQTQDADAGPPLPR